MRWEVRGADKRTGEDVVRVFAGGSEESAAQQARDDGLLVESIDLLIDTDADALPVGTRIERGAGHVSATLDYRRPATNAGGVPTYPGLSVAGTVLRVYAYLCYALAALWLACVVGAAVIAAAGNTPPNPFSASAAAALEVTAWIALLTPMLVLIFAGAIAHGLGSACSAIRDIARNSWR